MLVTLTIYAFSMTLIVFVLIRVINTQRAKIRDHKKNEATERKGRTQETIELQRLRREAANRLKQEETARHAQEERLRQQEVEVQQQKQAAREALRGDLQTKIALLATRAKLRLEAVLNDTMTLLHSRAAENLHVSLEALEHAALRKMKNARRTAHAKAIRDPRKKLRYEKNPRKRIQFFEDYVNPPLRQIAKGLRHRATQSINNEIRTGVARLRNRARMCMRTETHMTVSVLREYAREVITIQALTDGSDLGLLTEGVANLLRGEIQQHKGHLQLLILCLCHDFRESLEITLGELLAKTLDKLYENMPALKNAEEGPFERNKQNEKPTDDTNKDDLQAKQQRNPKEDPKEDLKAEGLKADLGTKQEDKDTKQQGVHRYRRSSYHAYAWDVDDDPEMDEEDDDEDDDPELDEEEDDPEVDEEEDDPEVDEEDDDEDDDPELDEDNDDEDYDWDDDEEEDERRREEEQREDDEAARERAEEAENSPAETEWVTADGYVTEEDLEDD